MGKPRIDWATVDESELENAVVEDSYQESDDDDTVYEDIVSNAKQESHPSVDVNDDMAPAPVGSQPLPAPLVSPVRNDVEAPKTDLANATESSSIGMQHGVICEEMLRILLPCLFHPPPPTPSTKGNEDN